MKEAVMPFMRNCFLLTAVILTMLSSCPAGDDDAAKELIEILKGKPKKENQWGDLSTTVPNNIGNTFYADPETTRTISWQSGIAAGEVIIGNNRYLSTSVQDGDYYFHRVDITDLMPGKTYRFIAGASDRYSPIYSFKTKNSNYPNGFSVIHITDPQIGTSDKNSTDAEVWKRVIEAAVKKCPDAAFVANTGDVVDSIKETRIPYYFDYAQEILARYAFVYSLGNNDSLGWYDRYFYIPSNTGNRKDDYSGVLYSFDYGNTHFVSINVTFPDSYDDDGNDDESFALSPAQLTWLENDLSTTARKWKVVMTHKPVFGKKSRSSIRDNPDLTDLTKLFDTYNVNLVLAGHYHFYMRTYPINWDGATKANGTVWTIPNAAGAKYKPPPESIRSYIKNLEQPYLPMFTEFVFTDTNIYLNAYTVDSDGQAVPFDTYEYYVFP